MTPTQLFLASQKARRAAYHEALKGDAFALYWLESASSSVMADYANGDVVTIHAGRKK